MSKRMATTPNIPDDLVGEVLQYLPVISLLRFKCVSKAWYILIESPIFINNHLLRQPKESNLVQLWQYSHLEGPTLKLNEASPNPLTPFVKKFRLNRDFVYVFGPCNGVVCIVLRKSSCSKTTYTLCNPALREFKELPDRKSRYKHLLAMGFGNTSTDFKFVLIFEDGNCQLYTLSTNVWRNFQYSDCEVSPLGIYLSTQFFFNGACHWHGQSKVILAFNLSTEEVERLEYPPNCSFDENKNDQHFVVVNHSFALILLVLHHVDIWVMKDYGVTETWTKQFVIELPGHPKIKRSLRSKPSKICPIMCWKNGEWLLAGSNYVDGKLISCSLCGNEIVKFSVKELIGERALPYHESLISLKNK